MTQISNGVRLIVQSAFIRTFDLVSELVCGRGHGCDLLRLLVGRNSRGRSLVGSHGRGADHWRRLTDTDERWRALAGIGELWWPGSITGRG